MKKFISINTVKDNGFDMLLLLQNSDAPLSSIADIEKVIPKTLISGNILIDQILHSGNTDERYIKIAIENGSVKPTSISFFCISKKSAIRQKSRELLQKYDLIQNSALSQIRKKMLMRGISI